MKTNKTRLFASEILVFSRLFSRSILLLILLAVSTSVQAQFEYATNKNQLSIIKYSGSATVLVIPAIVNEVKMLFRFPLIYQRPIGPNGMLLF